MNNPSDKNWRSSAIRNTREIKSECSECDGAGFIQIKETCLECEGDGWVFEDDKIVVCPCCEGDRYIENTEKCSRCEGDGWTWEMEIEE